MIWSRANDNTSLKLRLSPRLSALEEDRYQFNKWQLGHFIRDLRDCLERNGKAWWLVCR
jgi:hypothetical protein